MTMKRRATNEDAMKGRAKEARPLTRWLVLFLALLLSLSSFATPPAWAVQTVLPQRPSRRAVVLALSGGGLKGYAHIGVLKVLEEHHIPIAGIVATSMGAIVGGLYSCGYTASELEQMVAHADLSGLVTDTVGKGMTLAQRERKQEGGFRPEFHFDSKWSPIGPLGVFAGGQVMDFLAQHTATRVSTTNFDELPIPFAAIATDLETGEKVVLKQGNLASAIRASMSLPGVFDPWLIEGRLLVDGGLVSNMPVKTAQELFPGYPVVAVDLTSGLFSREGLRSITDVLSQTITILTSQNVKAEAELADVLIVPPVREYPIIGDADIAEIISVGEKSAQEKLPQILEVLKNAPETPLPSMSINYPLVRGVVVTGLNDAAAARFEKELIHRWGGKPLDAQDVLKVKQQISARQDVRNVDYTFIRLDEGVIINYDVSRFPAHRIGFELAVNTLASRGALVLSDSSFDVFRRGDQLELKLWLSDNWAFWSRYFTGDLGENPWEYRLVASRYKLEPRIYDGHGHLGSSQRWQRYGVAALRRMSVGKNGIAELGVAYDHFIQEGSHYSLSESSGLKHDEDYVAPFGNIKFLWQDDYERPTRELEAELSAAWVVNEQALMLRGGLKAQVKAGANSRLQFSGGFMMGHIEKSPLLAAYLGARDELYSLSSRPIAGDRFVWGRLAWIHDIRETFLGNTALEIFAAAGRVWDHDSAMAAPWEVGISIGAPKRLFSGRLFALYSSESEWKFGLTFGIFDSRPFLPY